LVAELRGTSEADDFDPLMAAHNMIMAHVAPAAPYIMYGDYCPVCEFCAHVEPPPAGHRYATNESYMIDGPADAVADEARRLGLMNGDTTPRPGGPDAR
jgi:hypothetical protein